MSERDDELLSERETIFVRLAPTLNVIGHALAGDEAARQAAHGQGLLNDLYDMMDRLDSIGLERVSLRESRLKDAVGWGHVTRARQRGEASARQDAEVVLRRAAASLIAEADGLMP